MAEEVDPSSHSFPTGSAFDFEQHCGSSWPALHAEPAGWELPHAAAVLEPLESPADLEHVIQGDATSPVIRPEGTAWVFSELIEDTGAVAGVGIQRSSSRGAAAAGINLSQHGGSLPRINTSESSELLRAPSFNGSDASEKTQKVRLFLFLP